MSKGPETGPFCVSALSENCRAAFWFRCHRLPRNGTEAHATFPTLFPIPQLVSAIFHEARGGFWGVWLAGSTVPGVRRVRGLPPRFARGRGRVADGPVFPGYSLPFPGVWLVSRQPALAGSPFLAALAGVAARCPGVLVPEPCQDLFSWSPGARSRRPAERAGGYWKRGCGRHSRPLSPLLLFAWLGESRAAAAQKTPISAGKDSQSGSETAGTVVSEAGCHYLARG